MVQMIAPARCAYEEILSAPSDERKRLAENIASLPVKSVIVRPWNAHQTTFSQ
jgi:hypothetical protein